MNEQVKRSGLQVDGRLAAFIEDEVIAPLGLDVAQFWAGFSQLCDQFAPRNRDLLARRQELQTQINGWHKARAGQPHDDAAYRAFLEEIGYIVPEPDAFTVTTDQVDVEIAQMAGPQLVVPVLNERFALNAANARWGSLYDALYGTDVLDAPPAAAGGYDPVRGAAVIAYVRRFLDTTLPGWEKALQGEDCPHAFATRTGNPANGVLFTHHGLRIEIVVDRNHPVGSSDPLGIADVVMEAALTTIIDLEDSITAVDAEDKLHAYRNWLGLMRGDLVAQFAKDGKEVTRTLRPDQEWRHPSGEVFTLPGRSLMLVRNVGHLMTNPAILLADGSPIPEGIMDAVITSAIGAHDLRGLGAMRNSAAGSIYIVKPKMHGPEECAFTNDLFDAVEDLLGLARHTVKVGVMDEERRTSANLGACIAAVRDRVIFINTGFLDRTGDEIHTSMYAGPMIRKAEMKTTAWIDAYEKRNVGFGLRHGLSGRAQIGKGMWAAPDQMKAMVAEKIGHPQTGANAAWVPSPTAATLHAMHYHQVDVFARQQEVAAEPVPDVAPLLTIPLADGINWSAEDIRAELDNNAQGLLGYVVRWVDQGVGCSKVPDINDVGLMEDRATLRISSQHMVNWLLHGVCSAEQIMDSLRRMAVRVDAQNADDPAYEPMANRWEESHAFRAACDLVFKGAEQPNGYTEPLLHEWRLKKKAALAG